MRVPTLRFKDSNGHDFPEWQEKPFKDVSKINQGLQIPISDRFSEDGENRHFYITNEFLKKDSKNQYFIENPPSSVLCSESDVLMTRTGNTGKVVTNVKGAFHNNFFKIGYDKNLLNRDFLCEFLSLEHTQSLILKLAGTSTIPDLNHGDFYKINISYPSLSEQTKIANFLTAVDEKITQLSQKHGLLTQYKKGVMQQIFSQELRFKDDEGKGFLEWEEKTLDEVCVCLDNKRKPLNDAERQTMQGEIPYWGANNIMDYVNDYIFDETIVLLAEDGGNFNEYKTRPIANISHGKCWVNNHTHVLKGKTGLSNEFLFYSLVHKNITGYVSGGTRAKLTKSEMLKILIDVPSTKEQTKIANFLTAIDAKITITKAQMDFVKQYKQGLLQQMFV